MNYLVLSNRVLLLENHWMLFHGKEKIKTNKPPKHKFKKKEREGPWGGFSLVEESRYWNKQWYLFNHQSSYMKRTAWKIKYVVYGGLAHYPSRAAPPPAIPRGSGGWPDCGRAGSLAHLIPRCCPCSRGPSPLFLFWTTAHFRHSLEFKVEAWGRPMLFTYQSLKNYWIKIASFSCDPAFSASVAHILCAGQGKSWREFLWNKAKVLTFEG